MTKKPVSNAPPPFEPLRGLSLPRSQSNGAQVHQVHKPDWSMWSGDQRVAIEEAVALTMDIDPTPLLRVQSFITPDALPEARRADFSKRQAALKRKFNGRTSCMLSDAVHYATQKEWSGLPAELVAMVLLLPHNPSKGAEAESAPAPTATAEPASTVLPTPIAPMSQAEATIARQDDRLKYCEAAGLIFGKRSAERLPNGVGAAADKLGISRQTLSTDLKAALLRRNERERAGNG